jgi:hypothetical protein
MEGAWIKVKVLVLEQLVFRLGGGSAFFLVVVPWIDLQNFHTGLD